MKSSEMFQRLLTLIWEDPSLASVLLSYEQTGVLSKNEVDRINARTFIVMRQFYEEHGIKEDPEVTRKEVEKIIREAFMEAPGEGH
jgi:hypothetical protein